MVRSFDSMEDFFAAQEKAEEAANATVTDVQRAIGWGDYFLRIWMPPMEEPLLIFGAIMKRDDVDPEDLALLDSAYTRGYRYGRCYSIVTPSGEVGDTHISSMIPLTAEQFEEARSVRWEPGPLIDRPWFEKAIFDTYRARPTGRSSVV